jgi:hypothetical protein
MAVMPCSASSHGLTLSLKSADNGPRALPEKESAMWGT